MTHSFNPKHLTLEPVLNQIRGEAVTIAMVKKNQVLFEKGDTTGRMYTVLSGQVALYTPDNDKVVELLEAGSVFGEEALFGGEHVFSAKALCAGRIIIVDPQKAGPLEPLTRLALQRLSERQARLAEQITSLKHMPPLQRLARLILLVPEVSGGVSRVKLPWRKNVISDRIGVRNETFSRLIPNLQEHGASIEGGWIVVTDLNALNRFATALPNQVRLRKPMSRGIN